MRKTLNNLKWYFIIEGDKPEPIKPTPNPPETSSGSSVNILSIIAIMGGSLFICNICLLYCYVKRRASKHLSGELVFRF